MIFLQLQKVESVSIAARLVRHYGVETEPDTIYATLAVSTIK